MATLTEKLQFILTADASSAIKGFKQIETSADKALAKTETGASKGMAAFQKYGAVVGSAGLVIGAAALKAADAFQNLALAAGKMADSTGLSTEAASRWIEVAGDMGIETATLETNLARMDKALATSPEKFAALGVAIARTAEGTVDVNGTFLNAINVINGISDPIKRAKVASELFGKGWTSMSELIATGAGNLQAALDSVDASKVITEEEEAKAKSYREAMDNLRDKFGELALKVGQELVPVLTDVANILSTIGTVAGPVLGEVAKSFNALTGKDTDNWRRAGAAVISMGTSEVYRGLRGVASSLRDVSGEMAIPPERIRELKAAAEEVTPAMERAAIVTAAQGRAAVQAAQDSDTLGVALYGVGESATTAAADVTTAVDDIRAKFDLGFAVDRAAQDAQEALERLAETLKDGKATELDVKVATEDTATALYDKAAAVGELAEANSDAATAEGRAIDGNRAMRDDLAKTRDSLAPGSPLRQYLIDYIKALDAIPGTITTTLNLEGGGKVVPLGGKVALAEGGIVTKPTNALIGEGGGPEAVIPLDKLGSMVGGVGGAQNITINVTAGMGADGNEIARVVAEAVKRAQKQGLMP